MMDYALKCLCNWNNKKCYTYISGTIYGLYNIVHT